jgi:hypothetical protein
MRLLVPPLAPLIRVCLSTASFASTVYVKTAQVLGFWRLTGRMANGDAGSALESDVEHDDYYRKQGLYDGNKTD